MTLRHMRRRAEEEEKKLADRLYERDYVLMELWNTAMKGPCGYCDTEVDHSIHMVVMGGGDEEPEYFGEVAGARIVGVYAVCQACVGQNRHAVRDPLFGTEGHEA
ncbi:MAG: hypothetical protein OXR67_08040 [Chloroflexota bacterium]|nr:hypothetical protein [Chloroflexota bacterium]